jgi:hypothetical protein
VKIARARAGKQNNFRFAMKSFAGNHDGLKNMRMALLYNFSSAPLV